MQDAVFNGAFGWIAARTDLLELGTRTDRARMVGVKQLAELATLAGNVHDEAAPALLEFAWNEIGHGTAIVEALAIDPAIAIAYLPFFEAGFRSPELDHELALRTWDYATWSALRRYAVGFMLETLGVRPMWSIDAALRAVLGAEGTNHQVLQVVVRAHIVFWRTAMGAQPEALTFAERAGLVAAAPACAERLTACGAIDPLCELIVANACVGGSSLTEAWPHIQRAQRPDGAVPPCPSIGDRFETLYHSTLVAALAAGFDRPPRRKQYGG